MGRRRLVVVVTDSGGYGTHRRLLTDARRTVTLGGMVRRLQRLDPERQRRRLRLLAELADAKALRDRVMPRRVRVDRLRELIASRRRIAG
jgi:hypothetical protein